MTDDWKALLQPLESDSGPRGRFAPSPTGSLHLGHARTLLLGWLQIRAAGGRFVLRIEDLDRQRCKPEAEKAQLEDLRWLGFDWDEGPDRGGPCGPYRQTERVQLYERALEALGPELFRCSCSRRDVREAASAPHGGELAYPGTCRSGPQRPEKPCSLRIRVGDERYIWDDRWRGPSGDRPCEVCGDFIVRGKDGSHVYQLACVVDDIAMGMTEVLRGEDLVQSTSRQLLLYQRLGAPPPRFTHVPLLRDDQGERLAKRRGSPTLTDLRLGGESPEELIGSLAHSLDLVDSDGPARPGDLLEAFSDRLPQLVPRR